MIALVRHADAGKRGGGTDCSRQLSSVGREQADNLVEQLAGFSPARILSSPYLRCRQSVEPLAAARGLPVEDEEALAEGHAAAEVFDLMRARWLLPVPRSAATAMRSAWFSTSSSMAG